LQAAPTGAWNRFRLRRGGAAATLVGAALLSGGPSWTGGLLAAKAAAAQPATAPATLYAGGPILTMAGPQPSYAEALVERGGRIV
jgi:hypothetical protein